MGGAGCLAGPACSLTGFGIYSLSNGPGQAAGVASTRDF
jgi:hypothetical protein